MEKQMAFLPIAVDGGEDGEVMEEALHPYQKCILEEVAKRNVVTFLPSNSEKLLLLSHLLVMHVQNSSIDNARKIAIIAPFRPMVQEQAQYISSQVNELLGITTMILTTDTMSASSGSNDSIKIDSWDRETWRKEIARGRIICAEVDIFNTALSNKFLEASMFDLIVLDECHLCYEDVSPMKRICTAVLKTFPPRRRPRIFGITSVYSACTSGIFVSNDIKSRILELESKMGCKVVFPNELLKEFQAMDNGDTNSQSDNNFTTSPVSMIRYKAVSNLQSSQDKLNSTSVSITTVDSSSTHTKINDINSSERRGDKILTLEKSIQKIQACSYFHSIIEMKKTLSMESHDFNTILRRFQGDGYPFSIPTTDDSSLRSNQHLGCFQSLLRNVSNSIQDCGCVVAALLMRNALVSETHNSHPSSSTKSQGTNSGASIDTKRLCFMARELSIYTDSLETLYDADVAIISSLMDFFVIIVTYFGRDICSQTLGNLETRFTETTERNAPAMIIYILRRLLSKHDDDDDDDDDDDAFLCESIGISSFSISSHEIVVGFMKSPSSMEEEDAEMMTLTDVMNCLGIALDSLLGIFSDGYKSQFISHASHIPFIMDLISDASTRPTDSLDGKGHTDNGCGTVITSEIMQGNGHKMDDRLTWKRRKLDGDNQQSEYCEVESSIVCKGDADDGQGLLPIHNQAHSNALPAIDRQDDFISNKIYALFFYLQKMLSHSQSMSSGKHSKIDKSKTDPKDTNIVSQPGEGENLKILVFCESDLMAFQLWKLFEFLSIHHIQPVYISAGSDNTPSPSTELPQDVHCNVFITASMQRFRSFDLISNQYAIVHYDTPKSIKSWILRINCVKTTEISQRVILVQQSDEETAVSDIENFMSQEILFQNKLRKDLLSNLSKVSSWNKELHSSLRFSTPSGAFVDSGSAIALLFTYCNSLSPDPFVISKPLFYIEVIKKKVSGTLFRCSVLLPQDAPMETRCAVGRPSPSKSEAKVSVCISCIENLYLAGELDEMLRPRKKSYRDESSNNNGNGNGSSKKNNNGYSKKLKFDDGMNLNGNDDDNLMDVDHDSNPEREDDPDSQDYLLTKITPEFLRVSTVGPNEFITRHYFYAFRACPQGNMDDDVYKSCLECCDNMNAINSLGVAFEKPLSEEILNSPFKGALHSVFSVYITLEFIGEFDVPMEHLRNLQLFHKGIHCWNVAPVPFAAMTSREWTESGYGSYYLVFHLPTDDSVVSCSSTCSEHGKGSSEINDSNSINSNDNANDNDNDNEKDDDKNRNDNVENVDDTASNIKCKKNDAQTLENNENNGDTTCAKCGVHKNRLQTEIAALSDFTSPYWTEQLPKWVEEVHELVRNLSKLKEESVNATEMDRLEKNFRPVMSEDKSTPLGPTTDDLKNVLFARGHYDFYVGVEESPSVRLHDVLKMHPETGEPITFWENFLEKYPEWSDLNLDGETPLVCSRFMSSKLTLTPLLWSSLKKAQFELKKKDCAATAESMGGSDPSLTIIDKREKSHAPGFHIHLISSCCRPLGLAKWLQTGRVIPSIIWRFKSLLIAVDARNYIVERIRCIDDGKTLESMQGKGNMPNPLEMLESLSWRGINEDIHSERLEMVGDSLLKLVTTVKVFRLYPDKNEGYLTNARGSIICNTNLIKLSKEYKITQFLRVVQLSSGKQELSIIAKPPGCSPPTNPYDVLWNRKIAASKKILAILESAENAENTENGDAKGSGSGSGSGSGKVRTKLTASQISSQISNQAGKVFMNLSLAPFHDNIALDGNISNQHDPSSPTPSPSHSSPSLQGAASHVTPLYAKVCLRNKILADLVESLIGVFWFAAGEEGGVAVMRALGIISLVDRAAPPSMNGSNNETSALQVTSESESESGSGMKLRNENEKDSVMCEKDIPPSNIHADTNSIRNDGADAVNTSHASKAHAPSTLTPTPTLLPPSDMKFPPEYPEFLQRLVIENVSLVDFPDTLDADNVGSNTKSPSSSSTVIAATASLVQSPTANSSPSGSLLKDLTAWSATGAAFQSRQCLHMWSPDRYPSWNGLTSRDIIRIKFGYTFQNQDILDEALTHCSVPGASNYQRLEFLGDAVLDFSCVSLLYRHCRDASEGDLTMAKSSATNNKRLAAMSVYLCVHRILYVGSPILFQDFEQFDKCLSDQLNDDIDERVNLDDIANAICGTKSYKILADTFEAIIGAIYLDSGDSIATICQVLKFIEFLPQLCSE